MRSRRRIQRHSIRSQQQGFVRGRYRHGQFSLSEARCLCENWTSLERSTFHAHIWHRLIDEDVPAGFVPTQVRGWLLLSKLEVRDQSTVKHVLSATSVGTLGTAKYQRN